MSLYMFYVRDDVMGVDYGVVSAVGVSLSSRASSSMSPQRHPHADVDRGVKG